jgi:hypothetical protein
LEGRVVGLRDFRVRGGLRRALSAKRAVALACAALLAACSAPNPAPPAPSVVGVIEGRWRVHDEGDAARVLGFVVKTRYPFPQGDEELWLVENDRLQDLGYVDRNGRAFRSVPFEEKPQFVATGSLEEGVRAILRFSRGVKLERLEGEWESAAFSRPRDPF